MIYDFGDVVVVPFPFVDMPVAKSRPALVISNQAFNAANGQTMLAMITSARASTWPTDIAISDQESSGLAHPSVVRWKVFTLPNGVMLRRAGSLGKKDRLNVVAAVRTHMAPNP